MILHQDGSIKHQRSNPLIFGTLSVFQATCTWLEDTFSLAQEVREVAQHLSLHLKHVPLRK